MEGEQLSVSPRENPVNNLKWTELSASKGNISENCENNTTQCKGIDECPDDGVSQPHMGLHPPVLIVPEKAQGNRNPENKH